MLRLYTPPGKLIYPPPNIGEPSETYASIWYIDGAEKQILVDAGGTGETLTRRGLSAVAITSPTDALKKIGIRPDEIDMVICTHLHSDHMECGQLYRNAKFVIQKKELEANSSPHQIEAPRCVPERFLSGLDFIVVDGDVQIINGIDVLFTPGHTRGGQSIMVNTNAGKVVISGLCTTGYNFEPPEPLNKLWPVIPPKIHLDVLEAFDSLVRIKQIADIVVPLHEAAFALGGPIPAHD